MREWFDRHGKYQNHCDQRSCKNFHDWGKYFALKIRSFVINKFLSWLYVLFGELYYFSFYIGVILPKTMVSRLNLSRLVLIRAILPNCVYTLPGLRNGVDWRALVTDFKSKTRIILFFTIIIRGIFVNINKDTTVDKNGLKFTSVAGHTF